MITDMRAVLWKEWRSLFRQPGGRFRLILTVGIPIGYFGIFSPIQSGVDFVDDASPWFIASVLPLLTVIMTAPDSFAGERERKTLRTLLASRLSDAAILWAKIVFSVLIGMGMTVATLALALAVVNIVDSRAGPVWIAGDRLAYMLVVALLLSSLAAGAAVLISLRAATVQQAQQTLAAVFFLIPTVLGPVFLFLSRDGDVRLLESVFTALGTPLGRLGVIVGLLALSGSLLALARARFTRSRLTS